MTNFEKIKNMSVKELAKTMSNKIVDCDFCTLHRNDEFYEFDTCSGSWEQWLKSEVEE